MACRLLQLLLVVAFSIMLFDTAGFRFIMASSSSIEALGDDIKNSSNRTVEYGGCKTIVIGAGWSGAYFAWRTTVDEPSSFKAGETCIFEATRRIGGRAYSKSEIPGMQDVRLDLGAYRFDQHAHPLLNHIFRDVLAKPTKCYDPAACNDKRTGKMVVAEDAYGNAWGYASGPETLVRLFQAKGGRIFLGHRLTNILADAKEGSSTSVVFENGVTLHCTNLFLNMPKSAIKALDKSNILVKLATPETKYALDLPSEEKGAKLFFIYANAAFRTVDGYSHGDFRDDEADPIPLLGRFHDFQGKCPPSAHNSSDCWGAILMYYDFAPAENPANPVTFLEQFQGSTSDPFTYIPRGKDCSASKADGMMCKLHSRFMTILKQRNEQFQIEDMDLPLGMVVSIWHARDHNSSLFPGVSGIGGSPNAKFDADPYHKIRNRVSKPLNNFNIYLANEAYSGGLGWAHPALVLTERIIHHYLYQPTPKWVNASCIDYLMGDDSCANCSDCVSTHWWSKNIEVDPPALSTTFDPTTLSSTEECSDDSCCQEFTNDDVRLVWKWVNESLLSVSFFMNGTNFHKSGYTALGFGMGMFNADIIVAFPNGTVQQRRSFGHVEPVRVADRNVFIINTSVAVSSSGMNVTFTVPIVKDNDVDNPGSQVTLRGGVNKVVLVNLTGPTSIMYAARDDWSFSSDHLSQHTVENVILVDFACSRPVKPSFSLDILPLFRAKDRDAMLFAFDLYNCSQVQTHGEGIYSSLADKTIHKLPTGMPPDTTWTIQKLNLFRKWLDSHENCSLSQCQHSDEALAPTFSNIRVLFRDVDRQAMLNKFDLWKYEDVKKNAVGILNYLQTNRMPCQEHGGPWSSDKVQLFREWFNCGMLPGDSPAVSSSDREVFFKSMNSEQFPEFRNESRAAIDRYLAESRRLQSTEDAPWYWKPLERYTPEAFEARMNQIYDEIVKEAAEYDPRNDQVYTTRESVIERIRQMGPFNLVDGYWISRCCPVGSWSEVHAMLWGILTDEMGNGDLAKNHGLLYLDLMHSVGLFPPPVNTQAFAFDQSYLDSAFTQPAYSATLAQFSNELFPELLGTTLQIEWSVVGIVPGMKLLKYWGFNAHFYELHVGIDNAVKGHGYRAKRAVMLYLDSLRVTEGDAAVQEAYKRIWTGFVAYDGLGNLTTDLQNLVLKKRDPAQQVRELIAAKASFGSMNHRERHLGKSHINKLFSNPDRFVEVLGDSAWIVPGYPEHSALVNHLTQFEGPMYKVFDDTDMIVWRNWIASFPGYIKQTPSDDKLDVFDAAVHLIKRLGTIGIGAKRHNAVKLWGMSPNFPNQEIHQSMAKWLMVAERHPSVVLEALKHPKNNLIVCKQPENSNILRYTLKPGSEMGGMFSRIAAIAKDLDDAPYHNSTVWTYTDILVRWIQDDCPLSSSKDATYKLFPCEHVAVKPIPKQTKAARAFIH